MAKKKTKKAKKTKLAVVHFPEEILTQIFILLPVKTLLQCKLVCKPWLSIISNPHFITSQLHHAIIASKINPTLLWILDVPPYPTDLPLHEPFKQRRRQLINEALLDTNAQDLSTSPVLVDRIVIPLVFEDTIVVASYNGIICLSSSYSSDCGNTVYLWNPSIGTFRVILSSRHYPLKDYPLRIGFGYDCISDDYKVVRFVYDDDNVDDTVFAVQVYSTNANCWTTEFKAPNLELLHEERQTNIVVNGVLYFTAVDKLISFDLHKEVVGQIPFPSFIERRSDVLDFEGSVAMVFESSSGVDLWVLEDASGQASWSVKFSMDEDWQIWIYSYLGAGQFYGSKSLDRQVVLYSFLFDYEKRDTKYCGLGEDNLFAALKYTPTLVSLNRFGRVV